MPKNRRLLVAVPVLMLFAAAGFLIAGVANISGAQGGGRPIPPGAITTPATMTPGEHAKHYLPGKPWDGRGQGNFDQASFESFSDYPLYWLGM